ncbi:unnamed protein product [Mycena citricolor]|uniref:Uncharacterized protein n=1 Tax=Mycena citricolor TaxID=2018698 RepID=A0AAD2HBB1_9AGAR|nr:unnamed protein product [Mycena citricolor]
MTFIANVHGSYVLLNLFRLVFARSFKVSAIINLKTSHTFAFHSTPSSYTSSRYLIWMIAIPTSSRRGPALPTQLRRNPRHSDEDTVSGSALPPVSVSSAEFKPAGPASSDCESFPESRSSLYGASGLSGEDSTSSSSARRADGGSSTPSKLRWRSSSACDSKVHGALERAQRLHWLRPLAEHRATRSAMQRSHLRLAEIRIGCIGAARR